MCYNADNIVCWPIYRPLYFAAFYEVEHCNKHYLGDLVAVRLLGLELPSSSPSSAQLLSPVQGQFLLLAMAVVSFRRGEMLR